MITKLEDMYSRLLDCDTFLCSTSHVDLLTPAVTGQTVCTRDMRHGALLAAIKLMPDDDESSRSKAPLI